MVTDLCTATGVMPRAGGVLDQDPLWVHGMYYTLAARARKEADELDKQTPKVPGANRG